MDSYRTTKTLLDQTAAFRPWVWAFGVTAMILSVVMGIVLAQYLGNATDAAVLSMVLPTAIASASLLVTLHSRSTSISDRIRALGVELNKLNNVGWSCTLQKKRAIAIEAQIKMFSARFHLSLVSVVSVILSLLTAFPLAISLLPGGSQTISSKSAFLIGTIVGLFAFGAICSICDLLLSVFTLRVEVDFSNSQVRSVLSREDVIDANATDTVIHFNRIFHDIWYRQRVELFDMPGEETTKHKTNSFFVRLFGMHHEEFHFFVNGLLPRNMYKQWLECLRLNSVTERTETDKIILEPTRIGSSNFQVAWEEFASDCRDKAFEELMSGVIATKAPVEGLLREAESKYRQAYKLTRSIEHGSENGLGEADRN
ncbi:MAG: hypothetical protein KDB03_04975 [Planctomycetales bacterium]|nr:hypothetical protein [Planctomycetales bacterium]